jgi:hypothetical protein
MTALLEINIYRYFVKNKENINFVLNDVVFQRETSKDQHHRMLSLEFPGFQKPRRKRITSYDLMFCINYRTL